MYRNPKDIAKRPYDRTKYDRGWSAEGEGRFWKRQLSKARRRAWKNPKHPGNLVGIEQTCNWKNT